MAKFSNTSAFGKPNDDKFDFDSRARELDARDEFEPAGIHGISLRGFLEQKLQQRNPTFESCSSETLGPGVYIRGTQDGRYELVVYRGRQAYDIYSGDSREELVRFAETLQQGR